MGNYRDDQDYQYQDYNEYGQPCNGNGGNGNGGNGNGNGGGGNGGGGNGGGGNGGGNNGDANVARLRWYVWNTTDDPFVPNSYQSIPIRPLCNSGRILCAIRTIGVRDRAFEFTSNLKILIARGIASGSPQPYSDQTPAVLMKP